MKQNILEIGSPIGLYFSGKLHKYLRVVVSELGVKQLVLYYKVIRFFIYSLISIATELGKLHINLRMVLGNSIFKLKPKGWCFFPSFLF